MAELAKAYVQIIPTAEGIQGRLTGMLGGEANSAGNSAGSTFSSSFGSMAKKGLVAAGAGLAAAAGAVAKVAKDAIQGFADYQQFEGGIETLFGDAQDFMMEHAANAFKTAGMSANEYMETAIQSGASMVSSLDGDTQRAAELMDMAISDMADNVNKMGTSMSSIQDAYRGFARGNFTMLDNLALGYSGTAQGMYDLMARAAEIDETFAESADFFIDTKGHLTAEYSDMVQAIHIVQDNMGITGTTAKEAGDTISGSIASMKSAWENLATGMANPDADLGVLISDMIDTAEIAFGNLMPIIEQTLQGLATLIEQVVPVIVERLPGIVEAVLPSLLSSASALVSGVIEALPSIIGVLIEQGPIIINELISSVLTMLPDIISLGLTLLTSLAQGIADNLPELVPAIVDVVLEIVDVLTDPETLSALLDASIAIIVALAEGLIASIPKIIDRLPEIIENIVSGLVDGAASLGEAAVKLMVALTEGLIKSIPQLVLKIPEIILGIVGGLLDGATELISSGEKINEFIAEGFFGTLDNVAQWGKDLIDNFVSGIKQKWEDLKSSVRGVAQGIKDLLGFSEPKEGPLSNFHTYAPDMMMLFAKGIRDNENLVRDQLERSLSIGDQIVDLGVRGVRELRPAAGEGGIGGAVASALAGCGIYMDGQAVGQLVTRSQANTARAYG